VQVGSWGVKIFGGTSFFSITGLEAVNQARNAFACGKSGSAGQATPMEIDMIS